MNADGNEQIQITHKEGGYPRLVSRDGKWIFYQSGLTNTIWKVSAETAEEIQVSNNKVYNPAFSPDGNRAAYFFRDKETDNKIGVINLVTNQPIKVININENDSNIRSIAWSNDSQRLNLVTNKDRKNLLWEISLDEENPHFIADLGDKEINDFTMAPDGNTFAFTRGEWLNDVMLISGLK